MQCIKRAKNVVRFIVSDGPDEEGFEAYAPSGPPQPQPVGTTAIQPTAASSKPTLEKTPVKVNKQGGSLGKWCEKWSDCMIARRGPCSMCVVRVVASLVDAFALKFV